MTDYFNKEFQELKGLINSSHKIVLSTHVNPDGDGLGAELGFYYLLKDLGKEVRIINTSAMAKRYYFIDPDNVVETYQEDFSDWIKDVDLGIIFDIGDYRRLIDVGKHLFKDNQKMVNIDHHVPITDNPFDLAIVDVNACSTGYMVWKYYEFLGKNESPLDLITANALYSALLNDTGSFRYSNISPEAHFMAAHLLTSGIEPNSIYQNIYENRSKDQIALLSSMISNVSYEFDGKLGYCNVTDEMLQICDGNREKTDGFSEFIRAIDGVELSFVAVEYSDYIKISFRSRGKYTINDVAGLFGGGGHKFASGASTSEHSFSEINEIIINYLKDKI